MTKMITMLKIGIWQRQERLDVVWFQQGQPQKMCVDIKSRAFLEKEIRHILTKTEKKRSFAFISAISPHQIWHKNLLLPQPLASTEIEQQCRFILEQELPIPLDELWFDYRSDTLKQGFQLEIFAIQRTVAKEHLSYLAPLNIKVLDNQVHSIIRAFEYLLERDMNEQDILIYQEQDNVLMIQPKRYQNKIFQQNTQDLVGMYQQFCQRYELQPQAIFIHRVDTALLPLPKDWKEVETELPLMALGNALWQQDTHSPQ